jgi:hypothetical protein
MFLKAGSRAGFFYAFSKRHGSSRIHQTKSMEPENTRNIVFLASLSARAM